MTIKESSQAHRTVLSSSTRNLAGYSMGGPNTIPMSSMKYSGVSSNSATIEATKFVESHKSNMRQYIINLVHRGQTIGPQSTQVGATTFRAPNMKIDHSHPSRPVFSTFP
jgi:hypothetical protein